MAPRPKAAKAAPKEKSAKAQSKANESLNDLALEAVLSSIETKIGKGAVMMAGSKVIEGERIPFNHPVLDAHTNGGIPRGKVTILIGNTGGGKTTATLEIIAQAQRRGIRAVLIEVEGAFDPDYARCIGVDTDELLFSQPQSAEEAFEIAEMLAKSKAVGLIVIDSITNLATQAELDGSMEDKQVGDKARLNGKASRKLVPVCLKNNVALVLVSQWRIDVKTGNKTIPGGDAWKFASSLTLDFTRKENITDSKGNPIGQISVVKTTKTRVSTPFVKNEIEYKFAQYDGHDIIPGTGGFNRAAAYINAALDKGTLKQSGSWFSIGDERICQGKPKLCAMLEADPALLERIK